MKLEQVNKAIKKEAARYRRIRTKWTKEAIKDMKGEAREYYAEQIKRYQRDIINAEKNCMSLEWGPRRKTFKGCNSKLEFNPITQDGTSYRWYLIARKVKNIQLVNMYNYSVTTSGHASTICSLLEQLGLKFVKIEAPVGLQNLARAVEHHVFCLEEKLLEESFKRTKVRTDNWYRGSKYHAKALKTLAQLGFKATKEQHSKAADLAKRLRAQRLERAKDNRMRVIDNATEADRNKQGYHVIRPEGYLGKWARRELAREALDKGFHALYIHRVAKLEVIEGGAA